MREFRLELFSWAVRIFLIWSRLADVPLFSPAPKTCCFSGTQGVSFGKMLFSYRHLKAQLHDRHPYLV